MGTWKIWFECYNQNGEHYGSGVHLKEYKRKCDAARIANQMAKRFKNRKFIVNQTNPWRTEESK